MIETIEQVASKLFSEYAPILFEVNTVMAIGVSWALTHVLKHTKLVNKLDRKIERDNRTRLLSIALAFVFLLLFKRAENIDAMLNVVIFMAIASPYIYKGIVILIRWRCPKLAAILSSDNK